MTTDKKTSLADERIAYEPHPVTPERKAELRAQGFKIVDAIFAPPEVLAAVAAQKAAADKKVKA